jgi:hypothetical protein
LKKNGRNAILVDLNPETLTVVEVANQNSGAELVRYAVRLLPPDGINPTWLKAVWHQEHFSHHRVIFCLPAAFVKYKSLMMPFLPMAQLEEALKIELESGNDGYQNRLIKIINYQKQEPMVQVNVALVDQELLNKELLLLKQAGLEVEWSGLRYQGLQNFINFNSGFFEESSDGASYLDFCGEKTEFGIIKDEVIVYRRALSLGSQDLLNAEDQQAIPDFLEEVRLSIAAYQADTKSNVPQKLGLFGKTEAAPKISQALTAELGLQLYIPEKTKLTGVITYRYTPGLAPLIGLALDKVGIVRQEALRIYTPEQDIARAYRENLLIAIGIGFVVIFVLSGIILAMQANFAKDAQTEGWLQHKSSLLIKLRRTEQQTTRNINQIKYMKDWLGRQNQELEFLLLLKEYLPEGTQITDLTIEDGIVKDLSGITPSASFLLNKIKAIPGLQNLKLKGTISTSLAGEIFQLEGMVSGKEPTK